MRDSQMPASSPAKSAITDPEVMVMQQICDALEPLSPAARARVLKEIAERFAATGDLSPECPIQVVLAGDFVDCTFPRGHSGPHSWAHPDQP